MPNDNNTPKYIKSLLLPVSNKSTSRRIWAIDLEKVWLPFFTATNVTGDTAIPAEALGAPIRLGYGQDGSVKFSKNGRPVTKIAKAISDNVTMVRENFVAGLLAFTGDVQDKRTADYSAHIDMARKAGDPIIANDKANLQRAMLEQMEAEASKSATVEVDKTPATAPEMVAV